MEKRERREACVYYVRDKKWRGGKIGEVVAKALHDAKHDASVRRVVLITEQLTPSPRRCQ